MNSNILTVTSAVDWTAREAAARAVEQASQAAAADTVGRLFTATALASGVTRPALGADPVYRWNGTAWEVAELLDADGVLICDLANPGAEDPRQVRSTWSAANTPTTVADWRGAPANQLLASAYADSLSVVDWAPGGTFAPGRYRVRCLYRVAGEALGAGSTDRGSYVAIRAYRDVDPNNGDNAWAIVNPDGSTYDHGVESDIQGVVSDLFADEAAVTRIEGNLYRVDATFDVSTSNVVRLRLLIGASAGTDHHIVAGPAVMASADQNMPADLYTLDAGQRAHLTATAGGDRPTTLPFTMGALVRRAMVPGATGTLLEATSSAWTVRADLAADGTLGLAVEETAGGGFTTVTGNAAPLSAVAHGLVELMVESAGATLRVDGVTVASWTPSSALTAAPTGYTVGAAGDGSAAVAVRVREAAVVEGRRWQPSAALAEWQSGLSRRVVAGGVLTLDGDGDYELEPAIDALDRHLRIERVEAYFVDTTTAQCELSFKRSAPVGAMSTPLDGLGTVAVNGAGGVASVAAGSGDATVKCAGAPNVESALVATVQSSTNVTSVTLRWRLYGVLV